MLPVTIVADSASELCHHVLDRLVNTDDWGYVEPRGFGCREIRAATYHLTDVADCVTWLPERRLNYPFMAAEFVWLYLQRSDVAGIARYCREIAKFSDDGVTFAGAYGPRVGPQWGYVRDTLARDHDSRQAVLTIWTPSPEPSRDVPCTVAAQFFIRDEAVESVFTMRSSDAWLGLPYDLFNFSRLTAALAGELDRPAGSLTLNVGSSHLYVRDLDRATTVLDATKGLRAVDLHAATALAAKELPRLPNHAAYVALTDEFEGRRSIMALPGGWFEIVDALRQAHTRDAASGVFGEAIYRG